MGAAHERGGSTDSPAYADALQNLGDHLNNEGRYEEAMAYFSAAREVYETVGWTSSMNYAVLLHNLGLCCFHQGAKSEAIQFYTAAKETYCSVLLGEDSPQFAELMKDMEAAGMPKTVLPTPPKLPGVDFGTGQGLELGDLD